MSIICRICKHLNIETFTFSRSRERGVSAGVARGEVAGALALDLACSLTRERETGVARGEDAGARALDLRGDDAEAIALVLRWSSAITAARQEVDTTIKNGDSKSGVRNALASSGAEIQGSFEFSSKQNEKRKWIWQAQHRG